jgi:hypothetical protein
VDIKGQQPSMLVNPLRHNAIIGCRLPKMKRSPFLATDFREATMERLAGKLGICPTPAMVACHPRRHMESWP